jgi:hypothetical protein
VIGDRRRATTHDQVQARVPERVLAAGRVALCGSAGPGAGGDRSPASSAPAVLLGVTPTRVYAFAAADATVGELVGVWERADTVVTTAASLATVRVRLADAGHAQGVELRARRWDPGVRRLVRLLLDPARG